MKRLVIASAARQKRQDGKGTNKATVRSFTRAFVAAQDQATSDFIAASPRKANRLYRDLMPEALKLVGFPCDHRE